MSSFVLSIKLLRCEAGYSPFEIEYKGFLFFHKIVNNYVSIRLKRIRLTENGKGIRIGPYFDKDQTCNG